MLSAVRDRYNAQFSAAQYQALLDQIEQDFPGQLDFRIAESPVFVPRSLRDKMIAAGESIIDTLVSPDFKAKTDRSIPGAFAVPGEDQYPILLTLDFAVCRDAEGNLEPQLIELQGFATLYAYQVYISELYQKFFYCPEGFGPYFSGLSRESYLELLREVFIQGDKPEHTILLEIYPEQQKTRIDFAVTKQFLGIEPVCLSKIRKSGRTLYYEKDGRKIEVRRIYNRVIVDDLQQYPGLQSELHLTDEVDAEWIAHPNWFFRVSKFTLPLLKSPYIPQSFFLSDLTTYPADLDNYVLKPLFSFAGQGVRLQVTPAELDAIEDRDNFLLQRRVQYEPALQSPTGGVKTEIRMMYLWPKGHARPTLAINLARMSRGEMIGVRYNKDFDWVGGTVGLFEP